MELFLLLNPTLISKSKFESIKKCLAYCSKILISYETIDFAEFNEQEIISRIRAKIDGLYQSQLWCFHYLY